MRLVEFKEVDKKNVALKESRIQHAEDLIFWEGSRGAIRAIEQLQSLSKSTQSLTIKWDGSPAVVFGRNPNGEFIFTDKSGFVAKGYDGRATNPADLKSAIAGRGKDPAKKKAQAQYASKMASVFDTLQQAVPENFQGYFVGDMLYFQTPKKSGDKFMFKPNVVEYAVNVNSDIGQQIANSKVGVVIHHTMTEDGKILPIKDLDMVQGSVLAIPPTTLNKKDPIQVKGLDQLKSLVNNSGAEIDKLLNKNKIAEMKLTDLPNILYTYTNSKVDTGLNKIGEDFLRWLAASAVSQPKRIKIKEYVTANMKAFSKLWILVGGIMKVKDSIINQLDQAQGDITATINGKPGGEGYVLGSPEGNIKLVKRSGFTKANRAINR
jgi:hypothetical protein